MCAIHFIVLHLSYRAPLAAAAKGYTEKNIQDTPSLLLSSV